MRSHILTIIVPNTSDKGGVDPVVEEIMRGNMKISAIQIVDTEYCEFDGIEYREGVFVPKPKPPEQLELMG